MTQDDDLERKADFWLHHTEAGRAYKRRRRREQAIYVASGLLGSALTIVAIHLGWLPLP